MNVDVDRLRKLAAGAEGALQARVDELARLRADLAALDGQTCTWGKVRYNWSAL